MWKNLHSKILVTSFALVSWTATGCWEFYLWWNFGLKMFYSICTKYSLWMSGSCFCWIQMRVSGFALRPCLRGCFSVCVWVCVCGILKHCCWCSLLTASKKPGEPLIISDIKKGSMAHRYEQTLAKTPIKCSKGFLYAKLLFYFI